MRAAAASESARPASSSGPWCRLFRVWRARRPSHLCSLLHGHWRSTAGAAADCVWRGLDATLLHSAAAPATTGGGVSARPPLHCRRRCRLTLASHRHRRRQRRIVFIAPMTPVWGHQYAAQTSLRNGVTALDEMQENLAGNPSSGTKNNQDNRQPIETGTVTQIQGRDIRPNESKKLGYHIRRFL